MSAFSKEFRPIWQRKVRGASGYYTLSLVELRRITAARCTRTTARMTCLIVDDVGKLGRKALGRPGGPLPVWQGGSRHRRRAFRDYRPS